MKRGVAAFTIVEFTIAVAIATLLGAAAVTRYNGYIRKQEFISGGERVAACLQRASILSRTNVLGASPVRFVRATIVSSKGSTASTTCQTESFSIRDSNGIITVSQLLLGAPAETNSSQRFNADGSYFHDTNGPSTLRVVYGALENGVPLGMARDLLLVLQPDTPGLSNYLPFGTGFSIDDLNNTIRLDSVLDTDCGVIESTSIGTPTTFKHLTTCS